MPSCSSESGEGSRCLRPRIWFWCGRPSSDCSREVLAAELAVFCAADCCSRWLLGRGTVIVVLGGTEGVVAVGAWISSNIFFDARVAMVVNTVILEGITVCGQQLSQVVDAANNISYQGQGWASRAGQISRLNSVVIGCSGGLRVLSYDNRRP